MYGTIVMGSNARTNLLAGEFSPSGVDEANCLRKFYYNRVLGLKVRKEPVALVYGIAIHGAVEKFYNLHGTCTDLEEIEIEVVREFVKLWDSKGINGDFRRNLYSGILTMRNYCKEYQHDMSRFRPEDIESAQWTTMDNGTLMLTKMDRILREGSRRILVDTKTSSVYLTDYNFFDSFENHLPTTLYYHVVQELLGHCDSIMIDAIKVPPPPAESKTLAFARQQFIRTELQVQDGIRTYLDRTSKIMDILTNHPQEEWACRFVCNQNVCHTKYGKCPYLGVCKYGLDHPSVKVDFTMEGGILKEEDKEEVEK